MARARQASDWERDLTRARQGESEFALFLSTDERIADFEDHTEAYDRLDYSFTFDGARVQVDLKEKIRPTSMGLATLWLDVPPEHLFVLDETVYRRIVWHGGGGFLVVHDHPMERWAIFGPWELTLGPRVRYVRWGRRTESFAKGKILLDLRAAAHSARYVDVDDLLYVVGKARRQRDEVEAVEIPGQSLPEVGQPE